MTLEKRIGMGCTLEVDKTGSTSFTTLAAIVDGFDNTGIDAEDAETTLLSELFKTYEKADIEPGTIALMIAYDPGDTESVLIGDLLKQRVPMPNWRITYYAVGGTSKQETFRGYLKGMGRTIRKREMIVAPITIKLSGDPGVAATP